MKKLVTVFITIIVFCTANPIFAQALRLAVEGNTAFVPGEFRNSGKSGIGPGVRMLVDVNTTLTLTASAGFLRFSETASSPFIVNGERFEISSRVDAIPVLGGFRYYPVSSDSRLYIGGQAGLHRVNANTESPDISGVTVRIDGSRTAFSFGPTFGVEFGHLDLSANYIMIEDANYFGLHLGYSLLNF